MSSSMSANTGPGALLHGPEGAHAAVYLELPSVEDDGLTRRFPPTPAKTNRP